MARPKGLVRFSKLAGARMCWRYAKEFKYGEGRPGTRSIMPGFAGKMVRALIDLWILSGLGPADRVVSAGAYVAKRGQHGKGRALDIDAIHWEHTSLIAHPAHSEPDFYFGVEAHFRRYFHTVLGWSYDDKHRGHWHVDDGKAIVHGFDPRSKMHKRFLQGCLMHVWHEDGVSYYDGPIDGLWGKKSAAAMVAVQDRLQLHGDLVVLENWDKFLLLTAIQGMRVQ